MVDCDALSALSPGAPLWVIPPLEQSSWSTRIDWYLGFQIRRALPHQGFEFSPTITELVETYEKKMPTPIVASSMPLMIASSELLPNHQTVLVPDVDPVAWVRRSHRVWQGLDRPATRIFLPKGLTRAQFEKAWPSQDAGADLQIVLAP